MLVRVLTSFTIFARTSDGQDGRTDKQRASERETETEAETATEAEAETETQDRQDRRQTEDRRTGQDRTGEDRTGPDRTGQDIIPVHRTAQDRKHALAQARPNGARSCIGPGCHFPVVPANSM